MRSTALANFVQNEVKVTSLTVTEPISHPQLLVGIESGEPKSAFDYYAQYVAQYVDRAIHWWCWLVGCWCFAGVLWSAAQIVIAAYP
jgi:hypothetical protein